MRKIRLTRSVMVLLVLVSVISGVALATGAYEVNWWDVSGGGGSSSGGAYTLNGTIGQPDAGDMQGGPYAISGGFWAGSTAGYEVFLPIVTRN